MDITKKINKYLNEGSPEHSTIEFASDALEGMKKKNPALFKKLKNGAKDPMSLAKYVENFFKDEMDDMEDAGVDIDDVIGAIEDWFEDNTAWDNY